MRETIFREAKQNDALARGCGNGSGHIFHRLNSRLQEGILEKAETDSEFTIGLCEGIGRDFKDLDQTSQNKLLNWAYQKVELDLDTEVDIRQNVRQTGGETALALLWVFVRHLLKMSSIQYCHSPE